MNKFKLIDDNESYLAHNSEFEKEGALERHQDCFAEYDRRNQFIHLGFEKIASEAALSVQIHIDVGSGGGWLLLKTAHLFKKVIGIEPSKAGVDVSKKITQQFHNISHINAGMIEALNNMNIDEPVFLTTSIVLSHIPDKIVLQFLKLINNVPLGSVLYFGEPYGKNRQQYLWHIRSKEWWAYHLPNWELRFNDVLADNYCYGVIGECVGKSAVKSDYKMTRVKKIRWIISGVPSRIKYVLRLLLNFFR